MEHPYAYENPDYIKVMKDISNYDAIHILRTRTIEEIRKINNQIQIIDNCINEARIQHADLLDGLTRQREELAVLVADLSTTNKHLSELDEKLTFPNLKGVEEEE